MKDRINYYINRIKNRKKKSLRKKIEGSVTIFLIIIMLPSFIFGGYLVDASRIEAAKNLISSAGDLSMNAVLSEYNENLYELYGLLATAESPNQMKNQIEMYFNNMLQSNSMLQGSDSATVQLVRNLKSYLTDPSSDSFDNLIRLSSVNDLSISGVESSKITNPDVLKNQIVEFMKYRGPASMASGIITKFKTIGDVKKQSQAMKKKIEYEDKVSDIGDECQKAYDAINELNSVIGTVDSSRNQISQIENAMSQIYEDLQYQFKSDNKYISLTDKNSSAYQKVKNDISKTSLESKTQDELYQYIKDFFDMLVYFNEDEKPNSLNNKYGNELHTLKQDLVNAKNDGTPRLIYTAVHNMNTKNSSGKYTKLYYYCKQYIQNCEKENQTNLESYNKVKLFFNDLENKKSDGSYSILYDYKKSNYTDYSQRINNQFAVIKRNVNSAISDLNSLSSYIDKALNSLKKVKSAVNKAKDAKEAYGNSVDALANSEYKTSLKTEYNASAYNLDTRNIEKLEGKISNYKSYISSLKSRINEGGLFYNKNLKSTISVDRLKDNIKSNDSSKKIKSNYIKYNFNQLSGTKPAVINANNDAFYKYLASMCKKTEDSSDETDKNNLNTLLNSSLDNGENANNIGNYNESISGQSGVIHSTNGSGKVSTIEQGDFDKKKTANRITTYIEGMGSLLESFGNLANIFSNNGEDCRNVLYMSEYMTEMFSYNTIEKEEGANAKSLTGNTFNNNKFYKSEIEYILCGYDTPKANMDAIKSKLFVTRFVFNLLYAFIDSEINSTARNAATGICAGMPFMIPLVSTVIICSFALGESTIDVMKLLDGQPVAVVKTQETFLFKPSSMGKTVLDVAREKVNEKASDAIDTINGYLQGKTTEVGDQLTNSVTNYTEKVTNEISDKIKSIISKGLFEKCNSILSNYDSYIDKSADQLEKELKKAFDNVSQSCTNDKTSSIVTEMISNYSFELVSSKLKDLISNLKSNNIGIKDAIDAINERINTQINRMSNNIAERVNSRFSSEISKLKNSVNNAIQEHSDNLKSATTEKINEAFDSFNESVSTSETNSKKKGNSSAAAGFTFTYKEYLKLFVILQCFGDDGGGSSRDAMLKRTANLIGINLGNDSNMSEMYTMVEIQGNVDIYTTFLGLPISDDGNDFDFENMRSSTRKINYKSVKGY